MDPKSESIKKELECPICLNQFVTPRYLPCLHTYCSSCIDTLCLGLKTGDTIKCPYCSKQVVIPEEGFPFNFFAAKFADYFASANTVISKHNCDECEDEEAVSKCGDCDGGVYLCQLHTDAHKKSKRTKNHTLEMIKKIESGDEPPTIRLEAAVKTIRKKRNALDTNAQNALHSIESFANGLISNIIKSKDQLKAQVVEIQKIKQSILEEQEKKMTDTLYNVNKCNENATQFEIEIDSDAFEDEYLEFITNDIYMKIKLGTVTGESLKPSQIEIKEVERVENEAKVEISTKEKRGEVAKVSVEWVTEFGKKKLKVERITNALAKVQVDFEESGMLNVKLKGHHVVNSPMRINKGLALWDEQRKHASIKTKDAGKLAIDNGSGYSTHTIQVRHKFKGNEEWFCQVSILKCNSSRNFMFGVVHSDIDPQQRDIYATDKAAVIWTFNHTAHGMSNSNTALDHRIEYTWKRGDKLGAYFANGKLSFFANGRHVGDFPKMLNTNQEYAFAGLLINECEIRIDELKKSPL